MTANIEIAELKWSPIAGQFHFLSPNNECRFWPSFETEPHMGDGYFWETIAKAIQLTSAYDFMQQMSIKYDLFNYQQRRTEYPSAEIIKKELKHSLHPQTPLELVNEPFSTQDLADEMEKNNL